MPRKKERDTTAYTSEETWEISIVGLKPSLITAYLLRKNGKSKIKITNLRGQVIKDVLKGTVSTIEGWVNVTELVNDITNYGNDNGKIVLKVITNNVNKIENERHKNIAYKFGVLLAWFTLFDDAYKDFGWNVLMDLQDEKNRLDPAFIQRKPSKWHINQVVRNKLKRGIKK